MKLALLSELSLLDVMLLFCKPSPLPPNVGLYSVTEQINTLSGVV